MYGYRGAQPKGAEGDKIPCLDAGAAGLEMSVKEEFKEIQRMLQRFPDVKPHAEQKPKKQEIKNSDFMIMIIKQQNWPHRNFVAFSSVMVFQG